MLRQVPNRSNISLPITYKRIFSAIATDTGAEFENPFTYRIDINNEYIKVYGERNSGTTDTLWGYIVTYGIA